MCCVPRVVLVVICLYSLIFDSGGIDVKHFGDLLQKALGETGAISLSFNSSTG